MFVTMKPTVASSRRRKFERVVFLVDVKVLLEHEDRRSCAAQIYNSVVTVLEKCNEQSRFSTLWGYVFFDSSRSTVASNTTIGRLVAGDSPRERFDDISQNLEKFGKVLEAVIASGDGYAAAGESRLDCIVRTLAGVASDFQWDPLFASDSSSSDEDMRGSLHHIPDFQDAGLQLDKSRPNLVFVFSCFPICCSELATFLDLKARPIGSGFKEKLLNEFGSRFTSLQSGLDSKNVQCCWIDVPSKESFCPFGLYEAYVNPTTEQSVARRCLSEIAWNFASLGVVANVMNFVPLRLIWNTIAYLTPKFLDRRVIARVHCSTSRLRHNFQDKTKIFSVEVHACSSSDSTNSSNSRRLSRLSRLFAKESVDASEELSSTSDRVEIVILSNMPRGYSFQLSTERYLVLQKPSWPMISRTETGKRESGGQRSAVLKRGEPSWFGLLVSLEKQGFVALVTVDVGGYSCQAILEPFTFTSALLTVLDTPGLPRARKCVPTRLSCHLSRVSRKSSKEKLEECAKERSSSASSRDQMKPSAAVVDTGYINEFERSFDSTLLKVVKEKRRGCVLFKSKKKHRAEWGKTLDPAHDLYQGTTSEPEKVSWQEYWRRVVKRLYLERMILDNNSSGSLGIVESSIHLFQQSSQNMIYSQTAGTSVGELERVSDLRSLGQASEPSSRPARDVQGESYSSVISTPSAVGGNLQLIPTTFPDLACSSFAAFPDTFDSRSTGSGDDKRAEREVPLTPIPERPHVCRAIFAEKTHPTPNSIGTPAKAGVNEYSIPETSSGYSVLEGLVGNVLSSEVVDLHQLAESIVREAYKKVRFFKDEVFEKNLLASQSASSRTPDASVAVRVRKLLLKKPKHLLLKYKKFLASAVAITRNKASILAEKLREHELQILFRLEILALEGEFHDEALQECLAGDVCQLLDNIQFHLVGGDWSDESLQQYCDRVIVSRYKDSLPSTISKIFSAMELNGYCDPSSSSSVVYLQGLQPLETQLSSDNLVSQSEPEATEPSSDAPVSSPGQQNDFCPNRGCFSIQADCKPSRITEVITSHSKLPCGKENLPINHAVQEVPHKREKRNTYHFSGGAHNLLRVKAVKPRDLVGVMPRKITFAAKASYQLTKVKNVARTRAPLKEVHAFQDRGKDFDVVCQTPILKLRRL